MKKRMLADVLWEAANERLCSTFEDYLTGTDSYSCYAVTLALTGGLGSVHKADIPHASKPMQVAMTFLYDLGLDYGAADSDLWQSFTPAQLQGIRYMWLLLAMHVAEDEGIEL